MVILQDSLQAFSSSIAGLLSSRAVLQGALPKGSDHTELLIIVSLGVSQTEHYDFVGVGVGDASASPTAALLLSVVQESMGRIATIIFAHRLGTSLEPECKMYRLAADVFNDTAMIFDCLSPALPKSLRVILLSFSSVLRALCGVAAGSSKASLSAHFAKWGNLGELNAVSPPSSSGGGCPVSNWTEQLLMFPQPPFLFSLGYNSRIFFSRIAARTSTNGQAEGLEPGNHNLINWVRIFRSHSASSTSGVPSPVCALNLSFELELFLGMKALTPILLQDAGKCMSSLQLYQQLLIEV